MKMRTALLRSAVIVLSLYVSISTVALTSHAQQRNDPQFDSKVAKPAHAKKQPRVLVDGAHWNVFSVLTQRVEPLVHLMRSDGLVVDTGKELFSERTLAPYDLLVILTAQGKDVAANPAFTGDEIDAVYQFVVKGGSMLKCIDHHPFGAAGRKLVERFGVNVFLGYVEDPGTSDRWRGDNLTPVYSRQNKGLGNHTITRGRDRTERLERVATFGGASLTGPKDSKVLFRVSPTAVSVPDRGRPSEGLGTSQALAMKVGKDGSLSPPTALCGQPSLLLLTTKKNLNTEWPEQTSITDNSR